MKATPRSRNVKTTVHLPPDAAELLRALADERSTSFAEVIRRALHIDSYLHDARKEGRKIIVEDVDKSQKELVLF